MGGLSLEGPCVKAALQLGNIYRNRYLQAFLPKDTRMSPKAGVVLYTPIIPELEAKAGSQVPVSFCGDTQTNNRPQTKSAMLGSVLLPTHTPVPKLEETEARGSRLKGRAVVYLLCQSAISLGKSRATLPRGPSLTQVPSHP